MHLNSAFVLPEFCPRKYLQTKVNCCAIKRIRLVVNVVKKGVFMGLELAGFGNQNLSKISIYSPNSALVGFGKSVSGHMVFNTTVIKLFTHGLKS
jgi:hypothetical protein